MVGVAPGSVPPKTEPWVWYTVAPSTDAEMQDAKVEGQESRRVVMGLWPETLV